MTPIKIHYIDQNGMLGHDMNRVTLKKEVYKYHSVAELLLAAKEEHGALTTPRDVCFVMPVNPIIVEAAPNITDTLEEVFQKTRIDLKEKIWLDNPYKRGTCAAAAIQQKIWKAPVTCLVYSASGFDDENRFLHNPAHYVELKPDMDIPDLCPTEGDPVISLVNLKDARPRLVARIIEKQRQVRR